MTNYVRPRGTFGLELVNGNVPDGGQSVHKFGRNLSVGTSFTPVCIGGVYNTPQVASATTLRVKAGNAADTVDGSGARSVYIEGLNEYGALVSEIINTAGTSASGNSSHTYMRLFRSYVASSGTYSSSAAGSHVGDIVIEDSAGTTDWLTIASNSFPRGQSEVAAYTVPAGKRAYLKAISFGADDKSKIVELIFFNRGGIMDSAAPYKAMRTAFTLANPGNTVERTFSVPIGPFDEYTDMGIMCKIDTGTTEVHCDFQLILLDM